MVNTWLTALSISGSPFTLPELNLPQPDVHTAGETYPWLTHTSALAHIWFGLKTLTWSWCALSWGHFRYSHDYWVTYQRQMFLVTQQHILITDRKLESAGSIIMGLPRYYSPLYVQLWRLLARGCWPRLTPGPDSVQLRILSYDCNKLAYVKTNNVFPEH